MFSIFSSPKFSSSLSSSSSNNEQENQAKKSGKCSKSSSFSSLRRRVNPLRAEVPSSSSMDTLSSAKATTNSTGVVSSSSDGGCNNANYHHNHVYQEPCSSTNKSTAPNVLKLRPSGCSEQQLSPPSTIADNAVGIQTTSPLSKKSIDRYSKALKMDRRTLQHYYEAFRLFDKNRDGSISTGELRIVMHSLGLYASDSDLKTLIDGFDENENGAIEFEEFVNLMLLHVNDKNEIEDLKHAFDVFDKDKDGYISSTELSSVMKSLGETMNEKEIRNLIREADKDGDGKVNFEEFQAMLKEPTSRSS